MKLSASKALTLVHCHTSAGMLRRLSLVNLGKKGDDARHPVVLSDLLYQHQNKLRKDPSNKKNLEMGNYT